MRWCLRFPFHSEEGRVLAYHYQERGHKYDRQKESGWSYAIADSSKVFHAQLTIHVTKWKTDDSQMTFHVAYNLCKNLNPIKKTHLSYQAPVFICGFRSPDDKVIQQSSISRFFLHVLLVLTIFFKKKLSSQH